MTAAVRRLSPGEAAVSSTEDVLLGSFARGVAVCLVGKSEGGLCLVEAHDRAGETVAELVRSLARRGSRELVAKLVAADAPEAVAAVRRRLAESGLPLVAEVTEARGPLEVVFHCGQGRFRFAENAPLAAAVARRRVLIVDDSRSMREALARIIGTDPDLEVAGQAGSADEALALLPKVRPDVMTLDVQMPGMDGITFLERHGPRLGIPVVMVSAVSREESGVALRALELGAIDYVEKPTSANLAEAVESIRASVKAAAATRHVSPRPRGPGSALEPLGAVAGRLLAIGASTGGTEAIKELLVRLPQNVPPILIVQHIPAVFSASFARRLDDLCPFTVREAQNGDSVERNTVLVAPGGRHMRLVREADGGLVVALDDGPKESGHKPSVDALFASVADIIGPQAVGVLLTGMGSDGAKGLLKMRGAGARTIAQDESTSVVYGMPRAAVALGAACEVLPLDGIAAALSRRR